MFVRKSNWNSIKSQMDELFYIKGQIKEAKKGNDIRCDDFYILSPERYDYIIGDAKRYKAFLDEQYKGDIEKLKEEINKYKDMYLEEHQKRLQLAGLEEQERERNKTEEEEAIDNYCRDR